MCFWYMLCMLIPQFWIQKYVVFATFETSVQSHYTQQNRWQFRLLHPNKTANCAMQEGGKQWSFPRKMYNLLVAFHPRHIKLKTLMNQCNALFFPELFQQGWSYCLTCCITWCRAPKSDQTWAEWTSPPRILLDSKPDIRPANAAKRVGKRQGDENASEFLAAKRLVASFECFLVVLLLRQLDLKKTKTAPSERCASDWRQTFLPRRLTYG